MTTRRAILIAAATAGLPFGARADDALQAELLKPGPQEDIWLGPADAPVTVIEYASLTCSHCARFHRTTWSDLKARHVDKGLARFALRPFPLDPLSTLGFMVALSDPARYYGIVDLLFRTQEHWAYAADPLPALRETLTKADFTQESFERVLRDQELLVRVNDVKERGAEVFKVEATPTFFINGQHRQGAISIEEFEDIIKPTLGTRKL